MGLSALSSIAGSQAQKQQAKYQAQVARNNAAIANMNATYAERAGAAKEQSEAAGYRGQATNFDNDAALAKASAPTTFSTILGAASAAGGTYADCHLLTTSAAP